MNAIKDHDNTLNKKLLSPVYSRVWMARDSLVPLHLPLDTRDWNEAVHVSCQDNKSQVLP
jgi:hypothetical protein